MGFDVTPEVYFRFMGRFSEPLAARFAAALEIPAGARALDVGCGPGALTAQLVARLGVDAVTAVDPSEPFVAAARARFPGLRVLAGVAESLPLPDDSVDLTVAQLVVHFLTDPVAGLTEMARVTRPGGVVAANVWDHAGNGGPLDAFWRAAHDLDPRAPGEAALPGTREGHLAELFRRPGSRTSCPGARRSARGTRPSTSGGPPSPSASGPPAPTSRRSGTPSGTRCGRAARNGCRPAPFEIPAVAWCSRGSVV